jgi:tetratricopeptide (TPR) repeat protein
VLLADGREITGDVMDRGTEFGFTSYPDGVERVLSLDEVREVRFAVPPGPLAAVEVFERRRDGLRAAVPVVALSSRAAVHEGARVRVHVSFRAERIVRRHVAGRLPGQGPEEVRLTARLTHPSEVAAALGAAAASAVEKTPGRPLLVLFLSASEDGEPERGEVRPPDGDAVEAAGTALSELRRRRLAERVSPPPPRSPEPEELPPASTLAAAREERAAGRLPRAARAIAGALGASPGDLDLLFERGRIRLAMGDFAGAEEAALDLAHRFPEDGTAHLLRAEAAFAAGLETDGAEALDRAALARHPEALLRRARRSIDEGAATDEIQSDLQTALAGDREAPAGLSARGALLLLMGRAPEAEEMLSRALAGDPCLGIALVWRGDARIDLDRPESAMADLSRAWSLGLREPSVLFQRGICSLRLRQYTLAIRDFVEYAKVRPASAAAVYNIACAHALAGSPEEALHWLGLAVEAGFRDEVHARTDPDLASLWGDPRFSSIFSSAERE